MANICQIQAWPESEGRESDNEHCMIGARIVSGPIGYFK